MAKKIIAFDLDGTIISSSAAQKAHHSWFSLMAKLVGDESVMQHADKPDYFPAVLDIMTRLTGLRKEDTFDKSVMVKYARNLYQMMYLAELKKEGKEAFVPGIVDAILDLKKECNIALITTAPEDMVLPALEIVKIKHLFDYVYRSPLSQEPSKLSVMQRFIKDVGKPHVYIGNENADADACKELGVTFALAKWGRHEPEAGVIAKFNLDSPRQIKGILDLC